LRSGAIVGYTKKPFQWRRDWQKLRHGFASSATTNKTYRRPLAPIKTNLTDMIL